MRLSSSEMPGRSDVGRAQTKRPKLVQKRLKIDFIFYFKKRTSNLINSLFTSLKLGRLRNGKTPFLLHGHVETKAR